MGSLGQLCGGLNHSWTAQPETFPGYRTGTKEQLRRFRKEGGQKFSFSLAPSEWFLGNPSHSVCGKMCASERPFPKALIIAAS